MVSFSIIVPTLNEAGNVSRLLEGLQAAIPDLESKYEIIFSDSGSSDGTSLEIQSWQDKLPVKLYQTIRNRGLAKAVLAAASIARGDIIVVMDCDLSHPVDKVEQLIHWVKDRGYDMAIGSRYIDGGSTPDWPLKRRLISRVATFPARFFTSVKDPMAGFFAVNKELIKDAENIKGGFKIAFEILTQSGSDCKVVELPIAFRDREYGKSKMGKRVIFEYLRQLLRLTLIKIGLRK